MFSDEQKKKWPLAAAWLEMRLREIDMQQRALREEADAAMFRPGAGEIPEMPDDRQMDLARKRADLVARYGRLPVESVPCPHCDNGTICVTIACALCTGIGLVTRAMNDLYDQMLEHRTHRRTA